MSSEIFPIVDINSNKIFSSKGNVANFYELIPPDLEQRSQLELDSFWSELSQNLNNLEEGHYYKFYFLNSRNFLETSLSRVPSISNYEIKESSEHLELFFGSEDFLNDLQIHSDYITVNGEYLRVFSIKTFSENDINEFFMPIDVDYCLSVSPFGNHKALQYLEKIRTKHQSSFLKNKKDVSSEGAYSQAEELIEDITYGRESLFKISVYFIVRAKNLDSLNQKGTLLNSYFKSKGSSLYLEGHCLSRFKTGLGDLFKSLIPGVEPDFKYRAHIDKTGHLKYLLPMQNSSLMDCGIQLSDSNDRDIYFNPFDKSLKSRNILVTGETGSGKSVFVNKVVYHLIDKYPFVILDKGGSFRKLTTYYEGVNMSIGFNPLQFQDPLYLREFVLSCVDKEKFDKLEKGKLLNQIKAYLNNNDNISFESLITFLEVEFSGISYYFEDLREFFIEEDLEERNLLYVDLEKFPKNIISPLIIFLFEYFKKIKSLEKGFVFDECWSFLKDHGDYISECFRTFRKTGALTIAISQALKDFRVIGEDFSNAITNNTYFKVIFPQELSEVDGIDQHDIAICSNLSFQKGAYSECYLKSSDNRFRKTLRIYLSDLEQELFHTEHGKDLYLDMFLDKNSSFFESNKEAINAFIGLKYGKDTRSFNDFNTHIWN